MTSGPDSPEKTSEPQKARSRSLAPVVFFASLAVIALSVAVLYGISGLPGKEMAASGAKSCSTAATRLPAISTAAKGEVAAFTPVKTARPAIDLAFQGPDGQPRTLSGMKGRVVLLNLWATWCVPCREEMPSLDRLQAELGGPDFEVVAVNIDTTRLERRGDASWSLVTYRAADGPFQSFQSADNVKLTPSVRTGIASEALTIPHAMWRAQYRPPAGPAGRLQSTDLTGESFDDATKAVDRGFRKPGFSL
jgi:thiol-disulfide isomerase/thioredoxin